VPIKEGDTFVDFSNQKWYLILLTITPFGFGWTGVQLFLVISGFLIHLAYLKTKTSNFSFKQFYIKRFFRIYPPYFVFLIFLVIAFNSHVFINKKDFMDFISHLLLVHNLRDDTFFSFNGSFWSLALEVQLYLIYPIFLFIRKSIGINKTLAFLLALYFIMVYISNNHVILNYFNTIQTFVLRFWVVWGLGAFLAEKYFENKLTFKVSGKLLLFFLILVSLSKTNVYSIIICDLLWSLFFIALIYYYLGIKRQKPSLFEKIAITIGQSSYSFYLIHQPIMGVLIGTMGIRVLQLSSYKPIFYTLDCILIFVIIFIMAMGYNRVIEKPSIELGKWVIKKMTHKKR
jgi:peptidoglycan/LPS O-acetylase OafA/YrhL